MPQSAAARLAAGIRKSRDDYTRRSLVEQAMAEAESTAEYEGRRLMTFRDTSALEVHRDGLIRALAPYTGDSRRVAVKIDYANTPPPREPYCISPTFDLPECRRTENLARCIGCGQPRCPEHARTHHCPSQYRPVERCPEENPDWSGERIADRVRFIPHQEFEGTYLVEGNDENTAATGSREEMIRLARRILAHLGEE